jgi:polysaccharide biosynthesis transport protein
MGFSDKPIQSSLSVSDIYYILFRHKWKIALISLSSMVTAAAVYLGTPTFYQSEARLFIRYVIENKGINLADDQTIVTSPDRRGENVINSELEVLTSLDLARSVVEAVGAERILAKAGGGQDPVRAANLIRSRLRLDVPRKSNIIRILVEHPDPALVQEIAHRLIENYYKKHIEIHRAVGLHDSFLAQQTDRFRAQLSQTEGALKDLKMKAGLFSTEESKRLYGALMSTCHQELMRTEAELAERRAFLAQLQADSPVGEMDPNLDAATQKRLADSYQDVLRRLADLRQRETELRAKFTPENSFVQRIAQQLEAALEQKKELEKEHPFLVMRSSATMDPETLAPLIRAEVSRIVSLEAKVKVLESQLERIRAEAAAFGDTETVLIQLERKKTMEEANFRHYSASLEKARIDEAIGTGISNIITIQEPTPPASNLAMLYKRIGMILGGGLILAFALAFFIELVLDQRIRRPLEVEQRLRLPLFLSFPKIRQIRRLQIAEHAGNGKGNGSQAKAIVKRWSASETAAQTAAGLFFEVLRDRLISYFASRKMTHTPKLVAVTSCSVGAGVSTMATGLALSLSEGGEGTVLLVKMNPRHGTVNGEGAFGLDELIESSDRTVAALNENLHIAEGIGTNGSLPRGVSSRLTHLVPKLKATDYDFIIFDLPPISQTSVATRVAAFMDLTLLVIEAERTQRESVRRAQQMLEHANASVAVVMNKCRSYVPSVLEPEI